MQSVPRACQLPHLSLTLSPPFFLSLFPFSIFFSSVFVSAPFDIGYLAGKGKSTTEGGKIGGIKACNFLLLALIQCCTVGRWSLFNEKSYWYSCQLVIVLSGVKFTIEWCISGVMDLLLNINILSDTWLLSTNSIPLPLQPCMSPPSSNLSHLATKERKNKHRFQTGSIGGENSVCDSTLMSPFLPFLLPFSPPPVKL